VAMKICDQCGGTQAKKGPSLEESVPVGKINTYIQKEIVRKRLYTLHKKEDYHCVVFFVSKGARRTTVDTYETPGFAWEFMHDTIDGMSSGKMLKDAMKQRLKTYTSKPPSAQANADNESIPRAQANTDNESIPRAQANTDNESIPRPQANTDNETIPRAQANTDNESIPRAQANTDNESIPRAQANTDNESIQSAQANIQTPMQKIVEGLYETTKDRLYPGVIVPVFPFEKEKVGEERFWLVLINGLSQKKFKGYYLEYVKEDRYKLGNSTSLYYGTILRPSEKSRNVYVVENVWTDGNFRVSSAATALLQRDGL